MVYRTAALVTSLALVTGAGVGSVLASGRTHAKHTTSKVCARSSAMWLSGSPQLQLPSIGDLHSLTWLATWTHAADVKLLHHPVRACRIVRCSSSVTSTTTGSGGTVIHATSKSTVCAG